MWSGSVRVSAIRDEMLNAREYLDLGRGAVRHVEKRCLDLAERLVRPVDEQDLWSPSDARQRRRSDDQVDGPRDAVDELGVENIDVRASQWPAQYSGVQRARIGDPVDGLGWILRGALLPALAFRLLARSLDRLI